MRYSKGLLVLTVTFLFGCVDEPIAPDAAIEPSPSLTSKFEAPTDPVADPGVYGVGYTFLDFASVAQSGRPLRVHVWYPSPDTHGTAAVYRSQLHGLPEASAVMDPIALSIEAERALVGATRSHDGPFPAVVVSPGWGNFAFDMADLFEHLASHGFVVVSLDHNGSTEADVIADVINSVLGSSVLPCLDGEPGPCTMTFVDPAAGFRNRAEDISFAMDLLTGASAGAPDFLQGLVDPNRIGMAGHSAGARMSLMMGGGSTSLGILPDERVRAILPMGIPAAFLQAADVETVEVPVLLTVGSDDATTPPTTTRWVFDQVSTSPRTMVQLTGASHRSYVAVNCRLMKSAGALALQSSTALLEYLLFADLVTSTSGTALEYCSYQDFTEPVDLRPLVEAITGVWITPAMVPAMLPLVESTRLTAAQATAFFRLHLTEEAQYERFLLPSGVRPPVTLTRCFDNEGGTFCQVSGEGGYTRQ